VSGFTAAVGGLILLTRLAVGYPLAGRELQLDSIVAVVIGGTSLKGGRGNILGAFMGAIVLSELNNVLNLLRINPYSQIAFKGFIIIMVVVIRALGERE
jgi:ribose transport system permease protein